MVTTQLVDPLCGNYLASCVIVGRTNFLFFEELYDAERRGRIDRSIIARVIVCRRILDLVSCFSSLLKFYCSKIYLF